MAELFSQNSGDKFYIENIRADCLIENNKYYSSIFLMDGTEQSWAAKRSEDGCGADIFIDFNRTGEVKKLYIKNGYGLSSYFNKNNRVKELVVYTVNSKLSKRIEEFRITLQDNQELQEIIFPQTITTDMIILEVSSIYKGNKYNDTCLAEISLDPITIKAYNYKPTGIYGFLCVYKEFRTFYLYDDGKVYDNYKKDSLIVDLHAYDCDWGYTNNGGVYIRLFAKVFEPMSENYSNCEVDYTSWDYTNLKDPSYFDR